ncbi:MAG TPA: hypothetical protein VGX37_01400 [Allosphingosinicella sp.]|nr:hypothetical protein [Allosphingosinicella sp.]
MSRTGAALAAGIALLASCAPVPAADESPGEAAEQRSEIVFYDYRTPDRRVGELSARFDDGAGERAVPPSEFREREFGFPSSANYRTRSSGTVRVTVALRHEGHVSEGSFELPLRPDWRYGIALHLTRGEAPEGCMGCMGGKAVPLAPPIGEWTTLFVAWGGNSISQPAVY